ncbi:AaceriACR002Cp [[Ashbya] aceris (nom. inval.)]|nr:AaceriACR002Cp [[Ashbya] aceris (nom. inval.)]
MKRDWSPVYCQTEPHGLDHCCCSAFKCSAMEHVAATRHYTGINFRRAVNPPLRYVYKYKDWRRHTEDAVEEKRTKNTIFCELGLYYHYRQALGLCHSVAS